MNEEGPRIIMDNKSLQGDDSEWRYVPVRRLTLFTEAGSNTFAKTVGLYLAIDD
jgi:hypothetical protein